MEGLAPSPVRHRLELKRESLPRYETPLEASMRTPLILAGVAVTFAAGVGVGSWLSSAPPQSAAEPPDSPSVEAVTDARSTEEAAVLRERVRDLEDQLETEREARAARGSATSLHVPLRPELHGLDVETIGRVQGHSDGQIPPEITAEITAALEGALGAGELDCEDGDCVLLGADGEPMEGVQIQTMGDIDPAAIGALLQDALGDQAVIGEAEVGVMILEAEAEIIED